MVSKRQIAEVVLNRLNGGKIDRDSKVTIRQAMFAVGEARNALIQATAFESYSAFSEWDVPFEIIGEYYVKSQFDDIKKSWYVALPVSVINMHEGRGVYHVSRIGEEADDFVPEKSGSTSLFSGLEADGVEGEKSYVPRGNILELKTMTEESSMILRLIVNSHDLEDRADFMLPAAMEAPVTQAAFAALQAQIQFPQDVVPDNLPLNQ